MTIQAKFPSSCKACGCLIKPGETIEWTKGVGARHATLDQCNAAKQERAAQQSTAPKIDLAPLVTFLKNAQARGLQSPKLRVASVDGRTELRVSITKSGQAPGSLAIVDGGTFVGCVRPDGTTTSALSRHTEMQKHLEVVAQDPAAAAKRYAVLMGRCSFCGLPLTDEGSVEVGYGPVCAEHWGLPHKAKGTPIPSTVPGAQGVLPLKGGA